MNSGEEELTLSDGTRTTLRPILPHDGPALQAFVERLSPESRYFRFLEYINGITAEEADRLVNVDGRSEMAFVATRQTGQGEEIIGVARYVVAEPTLPNQAEVGIVVEDTYQSRGIGVRLMALLVEHAREAGICTLTGSVHPTNERLFKFIDNSGFSYERRFNEGVVEIDIDICH
jgi:acetyltransferase